MGDLGKCEHIKHEAWSSYGCHRDAVEEYGGKKLCKPHAAGAKRSAAAQDKARQRERAKESAASEAKRRAANINDLEPSLFADPHYVWHRSVYDPDRIEVNYAALLALINRAGMA